MKQAVVVLSALAIILWNPMAEASRSRLSAMGQDPDGSLFIKDARNVFLNPAWVNKSGNQVNFEWGDKDSNATPKAEGGLLYNTGGLNYGLQLGRVDFASQEVIGASAFTGLGGLYYPQNSIELILGREGEFTWGGSLHYVNSDQSESDPASRDNEAQVITGKFGMMNEKLQAYGHIDLKNDVTSEVGGVKNEYSGDLTLRVGGSFDVAEDAKVAVQLSRLEHGFDNAGIEGDREVLDFQVDYYRNLKATETDLLYYTFGLRYLDDEAKFDGGGGLSVSEEAMALPISIGVETKAKDWLVLRGSIRQEVIINKEESEDAAGDSIETNNADDTVVAAGAGFIFGSLSFDATFEGSTSSGQFDAVNMFGLIGMNYSF